MSRLFVAVMQFALSVAVFVLVFIVWPVGTLIKHRGYWAQHSDGLLMIVGMLFAVIAIGVWLGRLWAGPDKD